MQDLGVSQNCGYLFRGSHNRDCCILGSILGFPYLWKLPLDLLTKAKSYARGLLLVMTMLRYEPVVSKVVFDDVLRVDSLMLWFVQGFFACRPKSFAKP